MTVKPGWARKRPTAAGTLPSTTRKPDGALAPEERPLWELDHGEQRVLVITFVGGVASLVVAAVIVGAAIALAHALNRRHVTYPDSPLFFFILAAFALVVVAIGVISGQSGKRFRAVRRAASSLLDVLALVAALIAIVGLLTLIGMAAGVR
jgi:hypothetical protein